MTVSHGVEGQLISEARIFIYSDALKQEIAVYITQNEAVVVVAALFKRGKFFWDTWYAMSFCYKFPSWHPLT